MFRVTHRIVPLTPLYFLLAMLQFFRPMEDKLHGNAQGSARLSAPHAINWNQVIPEHSFSWLAEVEDSEESDYILNTAEVFWQPVSESYKQAPFLKKSGSEFRMYRARSGIDEEPLFLIHCNFRV